MSIAVPAATRGAAMPGDAGRELAPRKHPVDDPSPTEPDPAIPVDDPKPPHAPVEEPDEEEPADT